MVQFINQVADPGSHPAGRPVLVALCQPPRFQLGAGKQGVQVGAETLNLAECSGGDMAGVGFREPGQKRADTGVQRNDAGLGLADAPPCRHGHDQMILAIVQSQAAVAVVGRQRFGHPQLAQNRVIGSELRNGALRNEAALAGSFPAAEVRPVPVNLQVLASGLLGFELPVAAADLRDCPAGVSDRDAADLVRRGFEALRYGVDDAGLDGFPTGRLPGSPQPRHCFVVTPPGGIKPQPECPALLPGRIDPDPP